MRGQILRQAWITAIIWTLILVTSLVWSVRRDRERIMESAYSEARASVNKDIALRTWATRTGGIYVPLSPTRHPNDAMAHVPRRDLKINDELTLTLINPNTIVREMAELKPYRQGVRSRITALKWLNAESAPDAWEREQLEAFQRRERSEAWSQMEVGGRQQLRYLRAMYMDAGCVKCHGVLGFKEGDLRGAFGVTLPLDAYLVSMHQDEQDLALTHGGIWILGLIGIAWSARRLHHREVERRELIREVRMHARRFDLALHGAQDGIWDIHLETNEVSHSPRMHEMLGYAPGELPVNLAYWRAITHLEDYDRVMRAMRDHITGKSEYFDEVFRARAKDGTWRWLNCRGQAVRDDDGKAVRVVGTQTDVTTSKQLEAQLFAEKERAQVTLASIGDAVLTTDADGQITFMNPVAERITGWTRDDAVGMPVDAVVVLIDEDTHQPLPSSFERCRNSDAITLLPSQHTLIISRSGQEIAIDDSVAPIHDSEGKLIGMVMVFQDVSEARELTRQMHWQITHDALTGLVSRREFEHRLEGVVEDASSGGGEHALLYLDLDNFKVVNDTCGHLAGDELLKQLSFLLSEQMRRNDTLARLGGDEFGALLERCPLDKARQIAEKLRNTVHEFRFTWGGKSFDIGVSIGLVMVGPQTTSLAEVLSMADVACYAAKEMGRNRVHVYHAEDGEGQTRHREMLLATDIRAALDAGRFVLFAQELLALRGQPGRQIEILVRMQGPHGDLVPPGAFIPSAERYGLMPTIDRWVVEHTLAAVRAAHVTAANVRFSINLSGLCFRETEMPDWLGQVIRSSGIDPQRITFEITETAAVAQMAHGVRFIRDLKALGCRFALDDFGSGMSSFAYLKTLPVDVLKIDGAFIRDMNSDHVDRAFVEAIVRVAQILGMETVAECAEKQEMVTVLAEIGVDYVQGFAVGKPRPLEMLLAGN